MNKDTVHFISVGRIASPHGIKGWVKVRSYTQPDENLLSYPQWYLNIDDSWQQVSIAETRVTGQGIMVRIEGCHDRDQAARYTNIPIAIERDDLPAAEEGEYYWIDLIGKKVLNRQEQYLGCVDSLLETGTHDVLVVKGEKKYLIPYIMDLYIIKIDLENNTILVDWNQED